MSTELYQKVYDFLANSPLEHITASSVIFQLIEEEPWITKEESRTIVNNAINASLNIHSNDTPAQNKLFRILVQFDDAFEGVCSLRDIGAVKLSKEKPISLERIIANYTELKSKLTSIVQKKPSPLYKCLLKDLDSVSVSNLSWKSPLTSQVISDEWDKI
ncbi:unnamed protein product [Rhizophagus irregularis]|nr:unnamed protein product [Rhizophagus irregularis]